MLVWGPVLVLALVLALVLVPVDGTAMSAGIHLYEPELTRVLA